jgi:hypothetical protein
MHVMPKISLSLGLPLGFEKFHIHTQHYTIVFRMCLEIIIFIPLFGHAMVIIKR